MDPAPWEVEPAPRRAASGDRAAVEAMHARCSPESRTARWRAPLTTIPARYLDDALAVRDGHLALLSECRLHGVVALASAVETAPGRWELGVLVEDRHQRRGIGSRMTATLVVAVRDRGARQVVAEVGHDRRALLSRLGAFGIVRIRPDSDGVTGVLDLAVGGDGGRGGAAAAGSA
jgi:GNAT superfamily N-acetyltransferase